jgi:cobalt-zinc-cadmium efflux system membrane fusion protein
MSPIPRHSTSVLLVFMFALSSCNRKADAPEETSDLKATKDSVTIPVDLPQHASLSVDVVKPSETSGIHVTGRLVWNEETTVRVFSSCAGRVNQVFANTCQMVTAGQILATMESPDFGQAQADADKAEADLKLSERTLSRQQDLLKHGAAAQKDVEAAEDDLEGRKAERARAVARMKLYGADMGSVDGVFPLKAPLAGMIVEKNINRGQEVRPDMMLANDPKMVLPLFVISNPRELWVILNATELEIGALKPGQKLKIHVRAFPERVFEGTLDQIGTSIDPQTRTVHVRGSVANPDGILKAEMFASIDVDTTPAKPELPSARAIPSENGQADARPSSTTVKIASSAIFLEQAVHYVFVETQPGKYERRPVTVGSDHGGEAIITGGLAAGSRVVTDGNLLLQQMTEDSKE